MDGSYVSKTGKILKNNATDIICKSTTRSRSGFLFIYQSLRARSTVNPVLPKDLLQDRRPNFGVHGAL